MRRMLAILLLLAGCSAPASVHDPSLATLRQVSEMPLYEMTYAGAYDELAPGPAVAAPSTFACTLFTGAGLFARNFDWDAHPALLLHTRPPGGYASLSMVDTFYLGMPKPGRREFLTAPLIPFDGVNEKGLAIGLASDPGGQAAASPGKPVVSGLRIIRIVLDHAATVPEALALFEKYNVDFSGGPPLHYLIADASGDSAVVEFDRGTLKIHRPSPALANVHVSALVPDFRYDTALSARADTPAAAMDVLKTVAQKHTRWSVVYTLASGQAEVVTTQNWTVVHRFSI